MVSSFETRRRLANGNHRVVFSSQKPWARGGSPERVEPLDKRRTTDKQHGSWGRSDGPTATKTDHLIGYVCRSKSNGRKDHFAMIPGTVVLRRNRVVRMDVISGEEIEAFVGWIRREYTGHLALQVERAFLRQGRTTTPQAGSVGPDPIGL